MSGIRRKRNRAKKNLLDMDINKISHLPAKILFFPEIIVEYIVEAIAAEIVVRVMR